MTFPLYDLNIRLNPMFVAAIDQALQSDQAELVLVHTTPRNYGLFLAGDYLRKRARAAKEARLRRVLFPDAEGSDKLVQESLDVCLPGDLVFLPELRSSSPYHEVSTAARFVSKGATVLATIHGLDAENVRARLDMLWAKELLDSRRPSDMVLPPYRLIAYTGRVQAMPVRAA